MKSIINLLEIFRIGIFGKSCEPLDMCKELEFCQQHTDFIVRKLSTIIIRSTYYIFCMRNKPWTNPGLLIYKLLAENLYTKIYIPYTVFFSYSVNFFSFFLFFIPSLSNASYLIIARLVFVFLIIISLSEV